MLHTTSDSEFVPTSNTPTRPAQASRPVPAKSSPNARTLRFFEMPPVLLNGSYTPDVDFQLNGLAVLRPVPKGVGLGIDCIAATSFSVPSPQLLVPPAPKRPARSRVPRRGSLFDYEKSMASMKIDENLGSQIALVASPIFPSRETSEFNSLYDLDVQYPSSRSLNAPSPDFSLNYTYSPPKLSPSWSLDSVFSTAFSSPEDIPPSSSDMRRLPISWTEASKSSLSQTPPVKVEAESQQSLFFPHTPEMVIPLADINMFQASVSSQGSDSSINPAYIIAPVDHPPIPPSKEHVLESDVIFFNSTEFNHYDSNGFTRSLMLMTSPSPEKPPILLCGDYPPTPVAPRRTAPKGISPNLTHSVAPSQSTWSASPKPRIPKRKSSSQEISLKMEQMNSIIPGTPILNAHRGIAQADLEAKARRYQQRNPGVEDLDKQWLASFSGKLSDRGEMVEDFRCYVIGCTQVNKRRDHMIVHVGSHLAQRLFKCDRCPSRFMRKNELKRHEQSHDTSRPFVCHLCSNGKFGRKDLLTRHLKNTHKADSVDDRENARPRKKAKTESNN